MQTAREQICSMRRMRPLLGTFVEIFAEGAQPDLAPAIEAAFAAIERVHALMSFHSAASDVAHINAARAHDIVSIRKETYEVLRFARQVSELSDGMFDVAVAPVLVRRGLLPKPERHDRIGETGSYRDLELLPDNRIRWRREGAIDLGGIAKGYAVDRAIDALRVSGLLAGLANAGGDMRCFGKAQPIHIRDPDAPANLFSLGLLEDSAIATSGSYFSAAQIDGHRADALVDPRRKDCVSWQGSISVLAPDCMTADALTKVVRLAPDRAPQVLHDFDAQALVIEAHEWRSCGTKRLRAAAVM
jgi:FAD:protein FMN transferase